MCSPKFPILFQDQINSVVACSAEGLNDKSDHYSLTLLDIPRNAAKFAEAYKKRTEILTDLKKLK